VGGVVAAETGEAGEGGETVEADATDATGATNNNEGALPETATSNIEEATETGAAPDESTESVVAAS
jgi:hypothetical protein